jgi:hypothetical protein
LLGNLIDDHNRIGWQGNLKPLQLVLPSPKRRKREFRIPNQLADNVNPTTPFHDSQTTQDAPGMIVQLALGPV